MVSRLSLALVLGILAVGSHAARPIDVDEASDPIAPLSAPLEEGAAVSDSRSLLTTSYPPPPPPLSEFQGTLGRPTLTQTVELSFDSPSSASAFAEDAGTARISQDQIDAILERINPGSRRLLGHNLAHIFAQAYLVAAMQGSSRAQDGEVTVSADGDTANMNLVLYFPEGTDDETRSNEVTEITTSLEQAFPDDTTYNAFGDRYGFTTTRREFVSQVGDEETFDSSSPSSGDSASFHSIQVASLLGAVLLALLLA